MPELAPQAAREATLEPSDGKAARAIALCRLVFFLLVALVLLGSVLYGSGESGDALVGSIAVGAVFLGSLVASLAGFAIAAGAGPRFFRRRDERTLRVPSSSRLAR